MQQTFIGGKKREDYSDFEELFKVYAKAHGEPFSFGINKGGVTTKSNTDIDTKIDNQKLGAKSKYV